jgi:hypothetical protein
VLRSCQYANIFVSMFLSAGWSNNDSLIILDQLYQLVNLFQDADI